MSKRGRKYQDKRAARVAKSPEVVTPRSELTPAPAAAAAPATPGPAVAAPVVPSPIAPSPFAPAHGKVHRGTAFLDAIEIIDGKTYERCTFTRCRIVYKGGPLPLIDGCSFDDCTWDLEESATRTLDYLRSIYHGLGPAGRDLVEATFDGIREPPMRSPFN